LQTLRSSRIIARVDDETCDCTEHGVQPIAFVCNHIAGTPRTETVGFVSFAPEDANDLRDAWCDECDAFLQTNGGDWVEGLVEVPGGISVICAECYRRRESVATRAGKRIIHRIS
jgi:hypothetical protein